MPNRENLLCPIRGRSIWACSKSDNQARPGAARWWVRARTPLRDEHALAINLQNALKAFGFAFSNRVVVIGLCKNYWFCIWHLARTDNARGVGRNGMSIRRQSFLIPNLDANRSVLRLYKMYRGIQLEIFVGPGAACIQGLGSLGRAETSP